MNAKQQIGAGVVTVLLVAGVALVSWPHRSGHSASVTGTPGTPGTPDEVTVSVTSPDDMGPSSLREALFIAASAKGRVNVRIVTRKLTVRTALPPLMNAHGMRLLADPAGAEIDAQGLAGGTVLDVVGPNTSVEGLVVRNCPGAAVLVRARDFHLRASVIESCDVGVEVATNAAGVLLEENRFATDRIGVRFAAPNPAAVVVANTFAQATVAGLWAVRAAAGTPDNAIRVRDNHFTGNHSGVVAGNIPIVVEHNEFAGNSPDAAIHLVGAGAVIRDNRIRGTATLGIVAEDAHGARIEGNELTGLSSYAIMLRGSADTLLRANRISGCAAGIAFVLGDPEHPGTAVGNIISDPTLDGIDVIGDSPILTNNQVLRPHALALRVTDYTGPAGQRLRAQPTLQGNNFRANTIGTVPAQSTTAAVGQP